MKCLVTDNIKMKTSKGVISLSKGQIINVSPDKAKILLEKGKVIFLEPINIKDWLERLSDSERETFEERAAIMEFDGGMERERAEIEAIKSIIGDRVMSKCNKCSRVQNCMLTSEQRNLCEGRF